MRVNEVILVNDLSNNINIDTTKMKSYIFSHLFVCVCAFMCKISRYQENTICTLSFIFFVKHAYIFKANINLHNLWIYLKNPGK